MHGIPQTSELGCTPYVVETELLGIFAGQQPVPEWDHIGKNSQNGTENAAFLGRAPPRIFETGKYMKRNTIRNPLALVAPDSCDTMMASSGKGEVC